VGFYPDKDAYVKMCHTLQNAGYVLIKHLGTNDYGWGDKYEVSLTESGQKNLKIKDGRCTIQVSKKELVEITGIAIAMNSNQNIAEVEYTWRYDNSSPLLKLLGNEILEQIKSYMFGSLMSKNDFSYTPGQSYKSTVTMRKYDDGWRIVK
jgi:hypothetical protein